MTIKTRQIIFWGVLAVIIVAAILCVKFMPLWASLTILAAFFTGGIAGWAARTVYDRYVKSSKGQAL